MKHIVLCAVLSITAMLATARDPKTSPRFTTPGGTAVNVFANIDGGISRGIQTDTAEGTGGGGMYRFEVGAKILFPARREGKTWMASVSGAYCGVDIRPGDNDLNYRLFTVPVSIGTYGENGRKGRGFYWQLGTNVNYVHTLKNHGKAAGADFVKLFAEPFLSFGLAQPYILMRGREEVGNKRQLLGVFFSYIPGNLAKTPNNISAWTAGVRWTTVFSKGD